MNYPLNNSAFDILIEEGTVIGFNKSNQTNVHSTGGGGYVSANGGYIEAPTIYSTNTITSEFFIKYHNGTENPLTFNGHNLNYRDGHEIILFWGKPLNYKNHSILACYNVNTNQTNYFINDNLLLSYGLIKRERKIHIFVNILLFFLTSGLFFIPAIAINFFYRIRNKNRRKKKKIIYQELYSNLQNAFSDFENQKKANYH